MKRFALSIALLLLIATPAAWTQDDPAAAELKTFGEKAGYAIGQNIGGNLKQTGVTIDLKAFLRGMQDSMAGKKGLLTDAEIQKVLTEFDKQVQANSASQQKAMADKNLKEGAAFLAANAKK